MKKLVLFSIVCAILYGCASPQGVGYNSDVRKSMKNAQARTNQFNPH